MRLTRWEVWPTYSMYFSQGLPSLDEAATALVESGLAEFASTSDGFYARNDGYKVSIGSVDLEIASDHSGARYLPPQEDMTDFQIAALSRAATFRFSEAKLLSDASPISRAYVRAELAEWTAHANSQLVRFHPSIKIYENGIALVQLRMLSEKPISLEDFITTAVNSYTLQFDRLDMPPAVAACLLRSRDVDPYREVLLDLGITDADDAELVIMQANSTPLLSWWIAEAAGSAVSVPKRGIDRVLRRRSASLKVEGTWVGRPHVHLIQFDDQKEGAGENERCHGDSFGWIMARHTGQSREGRSQLPPSLREFDDDYSAYYSGAITLCVQSASSLRRSSRHPQQDFADIVIEHQAIVEMLDFGYMTQRRFTERAAATGTSTQSVVSAQNDLIVLELAMAEMARHGEIRTLLRKAWDAMGIQSLRDLAVRALAVRQVEASASEARQVQRWATALAVVLGVGGVPALAKDVLAPLWAWLPVRQPSNEQAGAVIFLGAAAVLVAALLAILRKWAMR